MRYREDFPAVNNGFIYLNNASTTYIPNVVIDVMNKYYKKIGANYGRGIDTLGYTVTKAVEKARENVASFLNASSSSIVFTRGTTASLNLVARSFGDLVVNEGDEIITSLVEHHSNFVPWQELAKRKNAKLIFVNIDDTGKIDLKDLEEKISNKTKIVAVNHSSNTIGALNNIDEISKIVHNHNAYLVVDGAQGIIHESVDVEKNNIDFYAFSAHKIYGPKGVGVLYGKKELLKEMAPLEFGGEMVNVVNTESSTFKDAPYKFEAGTMMLPEIMGLDTAITYFKNIGYGVVNKHIKELRTYTISKLLAKVKDIIIYNENDEDSNLILFNIKDIHAHDVASVLDKDKVIVRAGHHCAEPMMKYLGVPSTVRISFAIYNNKEDCDKLIEAIAKAGDYIDAIF